MYLKTLGLIAMAVFSTNLLAGGGATGISTYSRFNKIACLNADGSLEDALKISPVTPSHLVLDLMDPSVSIGGYVTSGADNNRCWVELWGHLTRKLSIESATGKDNFGTESVSCDAAIESFSTLIPNKTKPLWIDNDNVALPSALPASEYCSDTEAKVHVRFKFD